MVLNGEFEKKIFTLWEENKKDLAKKELFKFRLRNYERLERVQDKIFIDYRMAYLEYLDGNLDLASVYFASLKDIFDDSYTRISCEYDYYNYKWLYVNANENKMSKQEMINEMLEICKYYGEIGNHKMYKLAYGNIFRFEENEDKILDTLRYILESDNYLKINFLDSILNDCEKTSRSLYIKALSMVNEYRVNIDAV